ncbi:hypothetical protein [Pacificispira sp.]|uniref:hypothetical protein n=1 Tax=Pacificispira sp. TaxID=2888761 RepID=UPI003B5200B4
MSGWNGLRGAGILLVIVTVAGLIGGWDDAALESLIPALRQTNAYYDPFRLWISVGILGLFLIWAGWYLHRHHGPERPLPVVWSPILFWSCIAVSPVFLLSHHGLLPDLLFAEDGPMEYLTVLLLVVSAAFAGLAARHPTLPKPDRILLWVFVGGMLFLALEEISWGQRIFGIETPEALKESNVQGEINLHNLTVGWNEVVRMILACILSAVLLLLPRDAVPGLRGRFMALKPDGRYLPLIPILLASHLYDEWFEQVVSFAIVSYAWLIYRRSNSTQSTLV